jgi:hypothetical protein
MELEAEFAAYLMIAIVTNFIPFVDFYQGPVLRELPANHKLELHRVEWNWIHSAANCINGSRASSIRLELDSWGGKLSPFTGRLIKTYELHGDHAG